MNDKTKPVLKPDNSLLKNKCPCCSLSMYPLEDGQWTHLYSESFRVALKRDRKK